MDGARAAPLVAIDALRSVASSREVRAGLQMAIFSREVRAGPQILHAVIAPSLGSFP